MSVQQALDAISARGDQNQRMREMVALPLKYIEAKDVQSLQTLVDLMLSEDSKYTLFARQVIHEIASKLDQLPAEALKAVAEFAMTRLRSRVASYEEEDMMFREKYSDILREEGRFIEAAKCLSAINIERAKTVDDRCDKLITIAECFLEEDDSVSAEAYCNKAGMIVHEVENKVIELRYRVTYARILDSKRQFLLAANKYFELSLNPFGMEIDTQDLFQLLCDAATCCVLAPAGPQRSRLLNSLMKEDRIRSVPAFEMVKKMYLQRIVTPADLQAFSSTLKEHQVATDKEGVTYLERAVLQHNVLAASRVYKNMRLESFGALLGVEPLKAEKIATKMIREARMEGSVDQKAGIIHFAQMEGQELVSWDCQIQRVCEKVNALAADAAQLMGKAAV
uniref:COP9 signalosome complex subunit 4 n=1 Tax=Chromera velia CCMP2878 TaxID=1169474 RepID=A0A0G4FH25_9ALVE|mmetsp:Transcript_7076/g.13887  ORF Transcript_7076/g.13887 Transcript_7076/m.13887 type:complete len:395 (-) Transcript_7076:318-1502(-)|eukprot:Cvel_16961.t1-p1 / transcript=Cvel_16961.t1 / gene=Cvel_16961 / organism=Chromera_velia_CCMP2878 / gene_product=COP9 signalosome complex subunit 4, putative / transcript_product=COP9 signalosome complex subunit 4, putative / location=Cvel_scaffold1331:8356-14754(-) / protein_length=394 / sequence_SO=supercontig / SO=protein_coding / is_pseudo=false